jgi:hypothetical protein
MMPPATLEGRRRAPHSRSRSPTSAAVMLLDTDHVDVLKNPDHPRFASLPTQLNTSADQNIATTIITVEEHMRGWLAWIHRSDDVRRQVPAYHELLRLFDSLRAGMCCRLMSRPPANSRACAPSTSALVRWTSRLPRLPSAATHSFSLQIFEISNRGSQSL